MRVHTAIHSTYLITCTLITCTHTHGTLPYTAHTCTCYHIHAQTCTYRHIQHTPACTLTFVIHTHTHILPYTAHTCMHPCCYTHTQTWGFLGSLQSSNHGPVAAPGYTEYSTKTWGCSVASLGPHAGGPPLASSNLSQPLPCPFRRGNPLVTSCPLTQPQGLTWPQCMSPFTPAGGESDARPLSLFLISGSPGTAFAGPE